MPRAPISNCVHKKLLVELALCFKKWSKVHCLSSLQEQNVENMGSNNS
jgi:hypothetical protein